MANVDTTTQVGETGGGASGFNYGGLSSVFTGLGGAVSDLFGAQASSNVAAGDIAAAQTYTQAADIATQNEQIVKQSTDIQVAQENRSVLKTLGGQRADVAGSGFADTGTALDLARDSAIQGGLSVALLQRNGLIQANSYAEQAGYYNGMASSADAAAAAASTSSGGSTLGGVLQIAGTVASIASLF